jgi:DNA-binding CsgD family transcriptional regulator
MIVMSASDGEPCLTLDADRIGGVVRAMGNDAYGEACFSVFENALDADHWALFVHRGSGSVTCIASASREHVAAAAHAVRSFTDRCYSLDPSLIACRRRRDEVACLVNMGIADISHEEYRRCFEITNVRERLSFYVRRGTDLHQLSVYRGPRRFGFSPSEMRRFAGLADLIIAMTAKHEALRREPAAPPPMDVRAIEALLAAHPAKLSAREREVCSRAAVGLTIEGTALDLDIKRTSVITYRQRAYQKLCISCQNELVALINNLRAY